MSTAPTDGAASRPGARPVIVLVHGGDFKPAAPVLQELSFGALAAGMQRDCPEMLGAFQAADKRMAYYGDLVNAVLRQTRRQYDESLDVGDRRRALHELKSLEKKKQFGLRRYEKLPGKSAVLEFAADLGAPLLGALGLADALIARVAADLREYWNSQSDFGERVRERVRTTVAEALETGHRVMLVSHGTGCVVSYDVLWQLSHDPEFASRRGACKVDLWLTLGAPLGDSTVRRRLLGATAKGRERHPANVLEWHNVSAEDDYMCHDNKLRNDFSAMLKLRQVSGIYDYHIYNLTVRYARSNPHSSIGYLIHPRVAKIVSDWLRRDEPAAGWSLNPGSA